MISQLTIQTKTVNNSRLDDLKKIILIHQQLLNFTAAAKYCKKTGNLAMILNEKATDRVNKALGTVHGEL